MRYARVMRLRLASFNLYNLVEPGVVFHGNKVYTEAQSTQKVRWVAEQLARMRAVVVGFQEVYHLPTLQRAARESGLFVERQVHAFDVNGEGPRLALASQFPVVEVRSIEAFPEDSLLTVDGASVPITHFRHPVLYARLRLPNKQLLSVFVAHLKSQRMLLEGADASDFKMRALGKARSLIVRAAEATALRSLLVDELEKDRPTVVIGDLNDDVPSVTTQIVMGEPPEKRLARDNKLAYWRTFLNSTHDIQARQSMRDVTYTHIYNGRYLTLDHILVSRHFARANPDALGYVEYLRHYNDHLIDEALSNDKQQRTESDHGQVVVSLRLNND